MLKYLSASVIMVAILIVIASFTTIQPGDEKFKNLKVLPKDITDDQLDSVMDHFKVSLGVKCGFCHAMAADSSVKRHLDFASDAKPEKSRAREMLQMTAYLNTTYFNPDHSTKPDTIHTVMCFTCHRGIKEPEAKLLFPQLDSLMQLQHVKKN
jgi:hypothetical protein